MSKDIKVRGGWLKGIYIYTIVGAGVYGLGMIVVPEVIKSVFSCPVKEPIVFGIVGSVYVAFGLFIVCIGSTVSSQICTCSFGCNFAISRYGSLELFFLLLPPHSSLAMPYLWG